jgi:UDP-4-amino-4,6-dideoxy-N-acetyl-beta-L-altrosamine transaminase
MRDYTPYGRHCIEEDDIAAVVAVLRSDYLTGGPVVEEFETAFAKCVGARHAVAVSSGTAGLHLASLTLGLGAGMLVIVPTLTFLATANAPTYTGAKVVFADVDPVTGLIGPSELEEALERADGEVKAVFPVHLNGQSVDMEALKKICGSRGIRIIEDASHALGGEYRTTDGQWHPVGSCQHSDMAVFSMHPVKNIAMGEGGMVTTNDDQLAQTLRRLRNHGMIREPKKFQHTEAGLDAEGKPNPWYYEMQELGYNYRASAIHCALGLSQLGKLDRFLAHRRNLATAYDEALAPLAPDVRPIPRPAHSRHAWHLYVVHINFPALSKTRAQLIRCLHQAGIGTQVHYRPVHQQPIYREAAGSFLFPGACGYFERCLTLPLNLLVSSESFPTSWVEEFSKTVSGVVER